MPKQSRAASLAESLANVAVGFGVACAANMVFLPMFGFAPSAADVLGLGAIMTAVSIARSYVLRRVFEEIRARRAVGMMAADIARLPLHVRVACDDEVHGDVPHVTDWARGTGMRPHRRDGADA